ncbi:TPA: serine hydrolase [Streptococcus suis]|nr:serine hydrolase [Streptococcus suis]HEM3615784.1 serine hydrolase [Streptococcus suis]HEM3618875.1 serine hydrolase [Streptococcus suis]HEM3620647.1 serine hydrolase [Streptococcus suis]HEM3637358.1 serine hydrolase [Streptococcus suis]
MKKNLLKKLLIILHSEEKVDLSYVNEILSDSINQNSRRQFIEIINCLREKSIEKVINFDESIIHLSFNNIKSKLLVNVDENGKLTRLEIDPVIPNFDDLKGLSDSLWKLNSETYLCHYDLHEQFRTNSNKEKFAIASLIKVVVGVIILEAIEIGLIDIDATYSISQYDLSYLSAGLSKQNIGQDISVRELLSYLFLASDNTAMDILLTFVTDQEFVELGKRIVDEFDIKIIPTRKMLRSAWCDPNLSEEIWRENSVKDVKWSEGFDYFINPKLLNKFLKKLMSFKWTPYTELSPIIYKGGNAPGVLSGFWGNRDTGKFVYFILNRDTPFNLIEELYCYQCMFQFLNKNIYGEKL